MTLPNDCLECQYHDSNDYPDDEQGDYLEVSCNLCQEWVPLKLWFDGILPDWCPLLEMWRR